MNCPKAKPQKDFLDICKLGGCICLLERGEKCWLYNQLLKETDKGDGMKDYKDWITQRANEIANLLYEKDYYDLHTDWQMKIYDIAVLDYKEELARQIDDLRSLIKEGKLNHVRSI